jgi:hypothetical protein
VDKTSSNGPASRDNQCVSGAESLNLVGRGGFAPPTNWLKGADLDVIGCSFLTKHGASVARLHHSARPRTTNPGKSPAHPFILKLTSNALPALSPV